MKTRFGASPRAPAVPAPSLEGACCNLYQNHTQLEVFLQSNIPRKYISKEAKSDRIVSSTLLIFPEFQILSGMLLRSLHPCCTVFTILLLQLIRIFCLSLQEAYVVVSEA